MSIANAAGRLLAIYKAKVMPPDPRQALFGANPSQSSDPLAALRLLWRVLEVPVIVVLTLAAGVLLAVAIYLRVLWMLLLALYSLLRRPRDSGEHIEAAAAVEMVPLISRRP